jgi:hypothetical protein
MRKLSKFCVFIRLGLKSKPALKEQGNEETRDQTGRITN